MHDVLPDLPDFLRIPQDERRSAWKGRKLTPSRVFATQQCRSAAVPTDPGTLKLLAEIAARETAEAERKAIAKEDARVIREKLKTRDRAVQAAVAQLHLMQNPNATEQEIEMAKAKKTTKKSTAKSAVRARLSKALGRPLTEKTVTTRFKATPPKKAEALKKPRPVKATRVKGKDPSRELAAMTAKAIGHPPLNAPKAPKAESKGAKLEAILRAGKVSAADLGEQLGWLKHTTRAAITRVGFEVTTEKKDGVTLYHIAKDAKAKVKADAA